MNLPRLAAAVVLVFAAAACAGERSPPASPAAPTALTAPPTALGGATAQAAARGQQLAAGVCARCHAVAGAGPSPMAEATPFREIVHRYPLDHLEEAFAEGLVTGHPAMPAFVFRAGEIDDLIAYLETVKAGP
ncbi:cytochrome c [uncultured Brevundimonas sp.]|uniref:c-type cytochrome n=1 Tax=uncultured Brevundimonas sp. TaxID=213418 RepID=UPI0026023B82|nr:cytochrome c [uncultured Brevundimonas sp.]